MSLIGLVAALGLRRRKPVAVLSAEGRSPQTLMDRAQATAHAGSGDSTQSPFPHQRILITALVVELWAVDGLASCELSLVSRPRPSQTEAGRGQVQATKVESSTLCMLAPAFPGRSATRRQVRPVLGGIGADGADGAVAVLYCNSCRSWVRIRSTTHLLPGFAQWLA